MVSTPELKLTWGVGNLKVKKLKLATTPLLPYNLLRFLDFKLLASFYWEVVLSSWMQSNWCGWSNILPKILILRHNNNFKTYNYNFLAFRQFSRKHLTIFKMNVTFSVKKSNFWSCFLQNRYECTKHNENITKNFTW